MLFWGVPHDRPRDRHPHLAQHVDRAPSAQLPQALGRDRLAGRHRRLARRPVPCRPGGIRTGRARHAPLAERHLAEAQLPAGKTLATFDFKALPTLPRARVEALAAGDWLDGGGNLIAIGNSGTGKTHVLCAIGHALVEAGHRVFYTRTSDLVQKLQVARRDLVLEAALAKLDRFDLIILDDITYAHKDQAETGVLFELIARRYEYRSIAIAANQPFSGWDQIFPDPYLFKRGHDRRCHRPAGSPRGNPGDER